MAAQLAGNPARPLDNTDLEHYWPQEMSRVYVRRALARRGESAELGCWSPPPPPVAVPASATMAIAAAISVFAGRMLTPAGFRQRGWVSRVGWLDDLSSVRPSG